MRKVKVVTGVIGKGNGGMSRFAVDLFKRLDPERFDVTFLSNDPHPFFGGEILENGGHIACIASRERHPLRHRADLGRIMREGNFDVCHIHLSTASNIEPLIAAKKAGVPLVIGHAHASGLSGGRAAAILHRINLPRLRKVCDLRLACSGLAGRFLFGDAPVTVVPNAIDLERFSYSPEARTQVREELGLDSGTFVLGHVGRIAAEKNPRFLLETFAALHKIEPRSALVYAGDGPLRAETEGYAGQLGIADAVRFAGQVPDPERYLSAFDAFLLPSKFEGLGFVIIESVCSGLRCYASDVIPEEARLGELVETFPLSVSKDALARRILEQRDDPAQRHSRKELLIARGYDAASQKRQIEAIYTSKSEQ